MTDVTIDFVAFDEDRDACLLILVEEGPWIGAVEEHLQRLQERIYGCLDAALDGQLAKQFPKSSGKTVVVRVDCYDLPREAVDAFVQRFANGIRFLGDYSSDGSPFVSKFLFEVNHDSVVP
jgi:hypothetical protein